MLQYLQTETIWLNSQDISSCPLCIVADLTVCANTFRRCRRPGGQWGKDSSVLGRDHGASGVRDAVCWQCHHECPTGQLRQFHQGTSHWSVHHKNRFPSNESIYKNGCQTHGTFWHHSIIPIVTILHPTVSNLFPTTSFQNTAKA